MKRRPSHDEIADLLGAYALHAIDADERALVDEHLEDCPRCRGELRDHVAVATLLGNSGGDAPDGLWDRIASTLEEAPPPMRLDLPRGEARVVPLAELAAARARRRMPAGLAAAAAAVAVIGLLGRQVVTQDDRIDKLQIALEHTGVMQAATVALADPDASRAELASLDGSLRAAAVLLPDGTGYLVARDLPKLDEDRTYQLWGQTDSGLVSLGLLGSTPNEVVPFQASAPVTALAVTAEESHGVVQSQNAPVMAGRLT